MIQQDFKRNLLLYLEFILKNYEIQVYCEKNHNIYKKKPAPQWKSAVRQANEVRPSVSGLWNCGLQKEFRLKIKKKKDFKQKKARPIKEWENGRA